MAERVSARLGPKGRAGGPFGQDKGEDTKVSRAAYSFGSGYGISAKACLGIWDVSKGMSDDYAVHKIARWRISPSHHGEVDTVAVWPYGCPSDKPIPGMVEIR